MRCREEWDEALAASLYDPRLLRRIVTMRRLTGGQPRSSPAALNRSRVEKSGEQIAQLLPCLKTDAGDLRQGRDTLGNDRIVAVAAEGLETKRVDLGTPEAKSGHHVEEMTTMRPGE